MELSDQERLIEKLKRIEALFADRAATTGEKAAAGEARDRIRQRLEKLPEPAVEYTFALRNPWSHRLFVALLRRYNIRPYRYPRQRRTTIMAKVPLDLLMKPYGLSSSSWIAPWRTTSL